MPVNAYRPDRWKADIAKSASLYGDWLAKRAPHTYDEASAETANVRSALAGQHIAAITAWLETNGYTPLYSGKPTRLQEYQPGTFGVSARVLVESTGRPKQTYLDVDAIIKPRLAAADELPMLVKAEMFDTSADSFRRRKAGASTVAQLRTAYGEGIAYVLSLLGCFDVGYLGYHAVERIDWVWAHRLDDLAEMGL